MRFASIFIMPPYSLFDLVLIVLAALYIASIITQTDGPFQVFLQLRKKTRERLGGLMDCIWCVVFWVALALFFLHQYVSGITWIFAIAGAAMALRSYTGTAHG